MYCRFQFLYDNITFSIINQCLTAINMSLNFAKSYLKESGKKLFWSIKNSGGVLDSFKLMIFFTLLYSTIQLKIHLLNLWKEPSKEKAVLILHVTTETLFFLCVCVSFFFFFFLFYFETVEKFHGLVKNMMC